MSVVTAPGQTVRHYRILERLGAGGMGVVFKAEDTKLGRLVALKFLSPDLTSDELAKQRFLVEARSASKIDHPNLCTVYEVGESEDGQLYIAMALYDGETLRDKIARGALPVTQAADILTQLARGLAKAHAAGIVHRDIKPGNIMVTSDGLVKILDFGLAKLSDLSITRSHSTLGTVGYMSPEQIRGERITPASDIWAVGVTTYEMLTGKRPFPGDYEQAVIYSVLNDDPPSLDRQHYSQVLAEVVGQSLKKDPSHRLQSANDLLEILSSGDQESTVPRSKSLPHPALKWRAGSLAALAFLVGVTAIYFLLTRREGTSRIDRSAASRASITASSGVPAATHQQLISTFAGSHSDASFSRDGKRIAFVNSAMTVRQLWVLNLGESQPRQLTFGAGAADHPRWSPVDERIAFTSFPAADARYPASRQCSIWLLTPGAQPRMIIDQAKNASWSGDGRRIVFERGFEIWTAAPDGSQQQRVDGVPPIDRLLGERVPALSPDGTMIAFFQPAAGPLGDIWVIPSEGGRARRLTYDVNFCGTPEWTRDGRNVVFSSMRGGSRTLWRVGVTGGAPVPLLISSGDDTEPALSPDGRRLVYTNTRNAYVVKVTDPHSGSTRDLFESRNMAVSSSFSPDGTRVLFMAHDGSGDIGIYSVGLEGAAPVEIAARRGDKKTFPIWSADGKAIYFYQIHPDPSFRRIDVARNTSSTVVPGWEWERENGASVDPSQKRILYSRLDRDAAASTMIRDIVSGAETPFPKVLNDARWSPDGTMITGAAEGELFVCSVDGGSCRSVGKGIEPRWGRNSAEVYFFRTKADAPAMKEVWKVDIRGQHARKVAEIGPLHPIIPFYDVAPDGRITWTEYREGRNELWLADLTAKD